MSWNKIVCETCKEEVTPKTVIRSNNKNHTVSKFNICPKCTFPITPPIVANQRETLQRIIHGMTARSHIEYPEERHINNMKKYKYDGHQHFIKQAELLNN